MTRVGFPRRIGHGLEQLQGEMRMLQRLLIIPLCLPRLGQQAVSVRLIEPLSGFPSEFESQHKMGVGLVMSAQARAGATEIPMSCRFSCPVAETAGSAAVDAVRH